MSVENLPRTTTIKELGNKLPIGFVEGKQLKKDFKLRPYKNRIDRHLNIWAEAHQNEHVANVVSKFLSLIVSQAGDTGLALTAEGDSTVEQEFLVHNWWFSDVMYMYIYSRIMNVGEIMELPVACNRNNCNYSELAKADLWSTEVRVIDNIKQLENWVTLKNGIKLRTGNTAKKVKIQPVKFRTLLMVGNTKTSAGGVGYTEIKESVCGVDCEQGVYTLTNEEIDDIDKIDMIAIDRQSSIITAGPDMRTNLKCPKCGAPIKDAFDWTFDNFFVSSVPLGDTMS